MAKLKVRMFLAPRPTRSDNLSTGIAARAKSAGD
jgi:hypothetical protein